MTEAFQNWAHGFHDFCPIGVAIAIVWLIGDVGYRNYVSSREAAPRWRSPRFLKKLF
jgi:hypothetical protein